MNYKHAQPHKILTAGLALLLALMACSQSPSSQNEPLPADGVQSASTTLPEPPSQAAGKVVIEASDPCSLLTKEQVESAFGKSVKEVKTFEQSDGVFCSYKFGENNDFSIHINEGAKAIDNYALFVTAGKQSCQELVDTMFEIPLPSLLEKYPSADRSLLELPIGDLYRQYLGMLGECTYNHVQDRPDVGENVLATELIFFNLGWSSSVDVFGNERVTAFGYAESIPDDANQAFQTGTDKESYNAIADQYRQQVLSGYTEILLGLLKQAVSK